MKNVKLSDCVEKRIAENFRFLNCEEMSKIRGGGKIPVEDPPDFE